MFECSACDLLFVDPQRFLTLEEQRRRYDMHRNNESDSAYVSHLSRLKDIVLPNVKAGQSGIDFGCGPVPVLSQLFEGCGYSMVNYDPIYCPQWPYREGGFDFLTCCEVAEHFQNPRAEFERIDSLVRSGGWIGVMTNLREGERRTHSWWYLRDPTHVSFYSARTMKHVAAQCGWSLESLGNDVTLFRTLTKQDNEQTYR